MTVALAANATPEATPSSDLERFADASEIVRGLFVDWLVVLLLLGGFVALVVVMVHLRRLARRPQLIVPDPYNGSGVQELDGLLAGMGAQARTRLVRDMKTIRERVEQYAQEQHAQVHRTEEPPPLPRTLPNERLEQLVAAVSEFAPEKTSGVVAVVGQAFASPSGHLLTLTLQRRAMPAYAGITVELSDIGDSDPLRSITLWEPEPSVRPTSRCDTIAAETPADRESASPLLAVGELLMGIHRYDDAVDYLRRARLHTPAAEEVAERLGEALVGQWRQHAAVAAYALGDALRASGHVEQAIGEYVRPLPPRLQDSAAADWRVVLGGTTAERSGPLERLAGHYASNGVALSAATETLYREALAAGAASAAEVLRAWHEKHAAAFVKVGTRLLDLRLYDGACRFLQLALNSVPGHSRAAELLARVEAERPSAEDDEAVGLATVAAVYEQHGELDKARTGYEDALVKQPTLECARAGLERLLDPQQSALDRYTRLLHAAVRWTAIELWRLEALASLGWRIAREQEPIEQARIHGIAGTLHEASALGAMKPHALTFLDQARSSHLEAVQADAASWRPPYDLGNTEVELGRETARLSETAGGGEVIKASAARAKGIPSAEADAAASVAAHYERAAAHFDEALTRLHDARLPPHEVASVRARILVDKALAQIRQGDDTESAITIKRLHESENRGPAWRPETERYWRVLYNLACWYALAGDRAATWLPLGLAFARAGKQIDSAYRDDDLSITLEEQAKLAAIRPDQWRGMRARHGDELRAGVQDLLAGVGLVQPTQVRRN